MSEVIFDAPKGKRVMRYGMGVCVPDLWWCRSRRIWTDISDNVDGLSTHAPCKTVKAFRRHLRRHEAALKGREVTWTNRFVGCDARAVP